MIPAITSGAWDDIQKGPSSKHIALALKRALDYRRHHQPTDGPPAMVSLRREAIIGNSSRINACLDMVAHCAASDVNVLITGETGVGKDVIANAIHLGSPRREGPFIPVNCGAIPTELMESEFFGHMKGSFTGAGADKEGLFQAADGGTLMLDEVADLPLHMQVKLLRVIQEKAVMPIGARKEVPVDVRILSATHKPLKPLVEEGKFRSDLYFRLNVIELAMPSLNDRPDDIPVLAEHFLADIAREEAARPSERLAALEEALAAKAKPRRRPQAEPVPGSFQVAGDDETGRNEV